MSAWLLVLWCGFGLGWAAPASDGSGAVAADRVSRSLDPLAAGLARAQLDYWEAGAGADSSAYHALRVGNAEWDFMGRTFTVLALADLMLLQPAEAGRYLAVIDEIIEDTLLDESIRGQDFFLMGYAWSGEFQDPAARFPETGSMFVDGEIALMLGARRLAAQAAGLPEAAPPLVSAHRQRVQRIVGMMARGPVASGESYPDEAWLFCNTAALAALRLYDVVEGSDHTHVMERWLDMAQQRLVDPSTGMLVSSYSWRGTHRDGPEGSSIWASATFLSIVDPELAADQYRRARTELGRTALGLGWSREWAPGAEDHLDVDAGEIVPVLGASTSASGLAIVAAKAFGDHAYHRALRRSLLVAAGKQEEDGRVRFARSNALGDAVILWGMVQGPVFALARPGQ